LKILVAHNRYQQSGGEDAVVAEEVRMLQQRGHSVYQYTVDNDGITGAWQQAAAAARSFHSIPVSREISNLLASFQPEILHVHNFFPTISPAIYFAAERFGLIRIFAAGMRELPNFSAANCVSAIYRSMRLFHVPSAMCNETDDPTTALPARLLR
jgi:hypothetical protein